MEGGFGGWVSASASAVLNWLLCNLVLMLLCVSVTWASYARSVSGRWVRVAAYMVRMCAGMFLPV